MTNDTYEDIEFYENAILIGSYSILQALVVTSIIQMIIYEIAMQSSVAKPG